MNRISFYIVVLVLLTALDYLVITRNGRPQWSLDFNDVSSVSTPFLTAAAIVFIACLLWMIASKIYSVFALHYYLKSAEFELMEKYWRWRNSDGGDGKVQKNLKLFEDLTGPTIRINDNHLQSALIAVNHPPVDIFGSQAKAVYDTRVTETDKATARKNAVRLNASLLRLVLFGSRRIAQEKVRHLSAKEQDQLTASVRVLVDSRKLTSTVNLFLVKLMWHYPARITYQTSDGEVTGLTALERMATL